MAHLEKYDKAMLGSVLSGRYRIDEKLGSGGMGVVYRAEDPFLDREVAVKVLSNRSLSEQAEARFKREARLIAKMDHSSIVPIFDIGRHEGSLFYVMPLVRGATIQELIRNGELELSDTLEVIAQAAEALDYSHQRGVIHRDIKPENLMVTVEDTRLRTRVMDFGLAIADEGSRLTESGGLPGTLAYLSPEQILALDLDGRSDLYSLGTVLYECVVGDAPFRGTRYTLLYRIVHDAPPRPSRRGIDEDLERIILSCLAKEPGERPLRGNDLAAELRRYIAGLEKVRAIAQMRMVGGTSTESPRGMLHEASILPLTGRQAELKGLHGQLEAAQNGECQLVLLGGEAGMGKTRLIKELELVARSRGIKTYHGRFSEQESAFPFQGFGEIIQDFFRQQPPHAADLGDLLPDLHHIFPVISEIPTLKETTSSLATPESSISSRQGDRTHVFELLARSLGRVGRGRPTMFVLEDLQGAADSVEALHYLVRRLGPTPTIIVGTYCSTDVSRHHPIARLLKSFGDDGRLLSLVLKPLHRSEHRELIMALLRSRDLLHEGEEISDETADRIYESTEGNPFFAQELVQSLISTGGMARDDSGSWALTAEPVSMTAETIPETIQQAIESRLERLPENLLEILQVASVIGRSLDYEDLQGLFPEDLDEVVDRLVRDGHLDEDRRARGDRLRFSSGVVRDVLYGKLSRRRRRALHRRHAADLEERHAGTLERVYPQLVTHYSAADISKKTVEYALLLARSSLDTFGTDVAIRATRLALELVEDEEVDRKTEGELRYLQARALSAAGSIDSALNEATRAARALHRNEDFLGAAAAALLTAECAWQVRKVSETTRWVEKGVGLARIAANAFLDGGNGVGSEEELRAKQILRRLLLLSATAANLRGEYLRARASLEEAEELQQSDSMGEMEPLPFGGSLVTTLIHPLTTLDPAVFETVEDAEVLGNVYETLLRIDPDGHLVGGLAESWEGNDDGTVFNFRLSGQARFSDGHPLTAAVVKKSLMRACCRAAQPSHPGGEAQMPPAGRMIRGMVEYCHGDVADVEGIQVTSERQLLFFLNDGLPIFPVLLTDLRTAVRLESRQGLALGSGPFKILKEDRDHVVLERNDLYWRGAPPLLDRAEFRLSLDASEIANSLRTGDVDIGRDLLPKDIDLLLRDPRFRNGLVEATQKNTYFVAFNARGPAAKHEALRRALIGVIRTKDLVWRTMGRLAQPATCLIPPGILGHDPGRRPLALTRAEASALLDDLGLDQPIRLVAAIHPLFFDRYSTLLVALFDEWLAIGVEVAIETTSMEDYLTRWRTNDDVDVLIGRWVPDYDDPDNVLYVPFHSEDGFLGGGLPSDAADALMEQARYESRAGVRQIIYRKIEGTLAEQHAVLPLFHGIDYRLISPRVRGLKFLGFAPYLNYHEIGKTKLETIRGASSERTLTAMLPSRFESLDPLDAIYVDRAEVVPNVFETLTKIGDSARIVPGLAAEFRSEDHGRRFFFRLRPDVRFHDGRQLSAVDVRYTFERLLRRSSHVGLSSLRGARSFQAGESEEIAGLQIVSRSELIFELDEPMPFFPILLCRPAFGVVAEGTEHFQDSWRHGCIGTGPFRLARLVPGQRIELEANPHYWRGGYPRCERLVFELGVDHESASEEFRAGRLSLAHYMRPADASKLRRMVGGAYPYAEAPGLSTYYAIFNRHRGVFQELQMRRQFLAAFDLAAISRATLGQTAMPAQGILPPGLLGYEPAPELTVRNETHRLDGLKIAAVAHPIYEGIYAPFWQFFLRTAATMGIEIETRFLDLDQIFSPEARNADLFVTRWFADYPDPACFFDAFHSKTGVDGSICGTSQIDKMIESARGQTDPAIRHAIYQEIEQVFARYSVVMPLFHEQIYRFYQRGLSRLRFRFGRPEVAYEELQFD